VKYLYWMIVVFGITLISVSSSVVPVDDPNTEYDEAETPVNFAYPVSLSTVTLSKVATQVSLATAISRGQQAVREHGSTMYAIKGKRIAHASRPHLDLLCSLLC
jgi:hypothetical protein